MLVHRRFNILFAGWHGRGQPHCLGGRAHKVKASIVAELLDHVDDERVRPRPEIPADECAAFYHLLMKADDALGGTSSLELSAPSSDMKMSL